MNYISSSITIYTYTLFAERVYRYVGLAKTDYTLQHKCNLSLVYVLRPLLYNHVKNPFTSSPKQRPIH